MLPSLCPRLQSPHFIIYIVVHIALWAQYFTQEKWKTMFFHKRCIMLSNIITKHCNQFNEWDVDSGPGNWVLWFSLDEMHINKTCQDDAASPRLLCPSTRPARMMLPHLDSSVHLNLPVLGNRGNKLQLGGGSLELKASIVSALLSPIHLLLKSLHFIPTFNDDLSLLVYTTGFSSCPWARRHHPLRSFRAPQEFSFRSTCLPCICLCYIPIRAALRCFLEK